MSDCGVMSRRAAEAEILRGNIKVNGEPVELGFTVEPGVDVVTYRGKTIAKSSTDRYVTVMLNKPRGYVTTMSDEKGRKCVAQLVTDVGTRVYPVGRLDYDSEGLLLLTNDGDLANLLTHPKHHIPKIYHVKIKERITPEKLTALGKPMEIDGYKLKPVKAEIVTLANDVTVLSMTLYEGRNRQIRKMCESLDLEIISLKRIAIGDLKLGNLKPGTWKKLTKSQVDYLRQGR